jgi:hypothetical protein
MTAPAEQFPYFPRDPAIGQASLAPMLPLTLIAATTFLCAGCSTHPSVSGPDDGTADHLKVVVVNKGPEAVYEVKVYLGELELPFGSFDPDIIASRKVYPTPQQIGKKVTVIVEYENEDEEVVHLRGTQSFQVFSKGEVRLEIGNGKLLTERISPR